MLPEQIKFSACCEILNNLCFNTVLQSTACLFYLNNLKNVSTSQQNRRMFLCEPEEQKAVLCGSKSQSPCNYPVNSRRLPRQRFRQDERAWRGNSKPLDESQNHFSLCDRGDKATTSLYQTPYRVTN